MESSLRERRHARTAATRPRWTAATGCAAPVARAEGSSARPTSRARGSRPPAATSAFSQPTRPRSLASPFLTSRAQPCPAALTPTPATKIRLLGIPCRGTCERRGCSSAFACRPWTTARTSTPISPWLRSADAFSRASSTAKASTAAPRTPSPPSRSCAWETRMAALRRRCRRRRFRPISPITVTK